MFTILVVVRKKEDISIEEFRRVWKEEYGPMYKQMPQVKSYQQFHLTDRRKDDAEDKIDGVAILSFESEEDMNTAWNTEVYKEAAKIRESIMRETSVGVHVTGVDEIVSIIGSI
ncbi:MAG: EthD family reductase [Bacteriovoracaceae bacterium]|nr:EthD family reductase [Bacteriovoracaceae bacterium]